MSKKILIVDDEPEILLLIKGRLKSVGYKVETARDGRDAFDKVEGIKPDLIISDVMMPDMDGVDLFQALKSNPNTKDIPIIILTARGTTEESFRVLKIDDFIHKPFEPQDLLLKVNSVLEKVEQRKLQQNSQPTQSSTQFVQADKEEFKKGQNVINELRAKAEQKENIKTMILVAIIFICFCFLVILMFGTENLAKILPISSN